MHFFFIGDWTSDVREEIHYERDILLFNTVKRRKFFFLPTNSFMLSIKTIQLVTEE